jgi:hypothetical protein
MTRKQDYQRSSRTNGLAVARGGVFEAHRGTELGHQNAFYNLAGPYPGSPHTRGLPAPHSAFL